METKVNIDAMSTREMIKVAKEGSNYSADEMIAALAKRLERETQPKVGQTKGEFMQNVVSNYLNNTCCDYEGFLREVKRDHRYLQNELFKLCFRVIKQFSEYSEYDYDGRNEYAVRTAKEMMKSIQ